MKKVLNLDYTYNIFKDSYSKKYNREFFSGRVLDTMIVKDGLVLPIKYLCHSWLKCLNAGGVVDSNGEYVEISALKSSFCMTGLYEYDRDNISFIDKDVIYMGPFLRQWGHFLVEQTSRLWYEIQNKNKNLPIVYTGAWDNSIEGPYLEYMNILGIDSSRLINVTNPTKFRSVVIPEPSFVADSYFTKEYREIFEYAKGNIKPEKYSKVYFSRRKFNFQKTEYEFGEDSIEKFFSKNGYKIVYPEKLSVSNQIALIKGCEKFASVAGTLPHNLVFAQDGIEAVVINKTYQYNEFQPLINEMRNINFTPVDAYISLFPIYRKDGPFLLLVNENLVNYAKDNNMKMPDKKGISEKLLRKYFDSYLNINKSIPPISDECDIRELYQFFNHKLDFYKKKYPFFLYYKYLFLKKIFFFSKKKVKHYSDKIQKLESEYFI